ncbi:hypothetical protein E1301_Tti010299 [Triplophysa tibetana]|uniref:Uncharacterized protein n=1 Tax=Triplophysa tibetana TaxID=1572043 RepID=A0A5A9Q0V9_9TELE|nr:hypothetical protein E1301_Tti010299 [Triplophysa tibetana]
MRDVDKTTLQKQKLSCFIITGKRLSGRPSGSSSSVIGQTTARTSFLPEIVQKSDSDGRPAGRRGLRAPSDFTVLSEGNQRDSPCKSGMTNTLLPPLPRLHSLVSQPARVDDSIFKRSKTMQRMSDNMPVLKPLCVSIELITCPQKTGNAFTERPRLPSLVSQPAWVEESTFIRSKSMRRMSDNMPVLESSCVSIKPVPRPKKTGNAVQRPGCSAYPCHDTSSE